MIFEWKLAAKLWNLPWQTVGISSCKHDKCPKFYGNEQTETIFAKKRVKAFGLCHFQVIYNFINRTGICTHPTLKAYFIKVI